MYIRIHGVTKIEQETDEINHPSGKGTFRVTYILVTEENGATHEIGLFLKDEEELFFKDDE